MSVSYMHNFVGVCVYARVSVCEQKCVHVYVDLKATFDLAM